MKPYVYGTEGKPCIWPVPHECIWNGERYDIKDGLRIVADDGFLPEIQLFIYSLKQSITIKADLVESNADIMVLKCSNEIIGNEGYFLDIDCKGIIVKANTNSGIFNGLQTLLQLVANSPGLSVSGVNITDKPASTVRQIDVNLPESDSRPEVERFVDFVARYKINNIKFMVCNNGRSSYMYSGMSLDDLTEYAGQRHVKVFICDRDNIHRTDGNNSRDLLNTRDGIYSIIKSAHALWRTELGTETVGFTTEPLPDHLEKIALQLYPIERDYITGRQHPSTYGRSFKTINLRDFYNAPLYKLTWRSGDYDLMYLVDAPFIPNTVPFSIFQGINDFKLESSLVHGGMGWNNGVFGIPVNCCLKSLVFLQTYTADIGLSAVGNGNMDTEAVGRYYIHFSDGTSESADIVYGRTITYWKADLPAGIAACDANPVFAGTTGYGDRYIIYAQEWINPKPEIPVEKVDLELCGNLNEIGIALFGITAVL